MEPCITVCLPYKSSTSWNANKTSNANPKILILRFPHIHDLPYIQHINISTDNAIDTFIRQSPPSHTSILPISNNGTTPNHLTNPRAYIFRCSTPSNTALSISETLWRTFIECTSTIRKQSTRMATTIDYFRNRICFDSSGSRTCIYKSHITIDC